MTTSGKTRTRTRPQIHMEDKIVTNPDLEVALEEREEMKEAAANFRKQDKKVKDLIVKDGTELPFRIGRFIIGKQNVDARHVEFEAEASSRITIKTVSE